MPLIKKNLPLNTRLPTFDQDLKLHLSHQHPLSNIRAFYPKVSGVYSTKEATKHTSSIFQPCAVSKINDQCAVSNVLTSWIRPNNLWSDFFHCNWILTSIVYLLLILNRPRSQVLLVKARSQSTARHCLPGNKSK